MKRPAVVVFCVSVLLQTFLFLLIEGQSLKGNEGYYLDSTGSICYDTIDTVQKVEYDHQIHCTVSPVKVCDDDDPAQAVLDRIKQNVLGRRIGEQKASSSQTREEIFGRGGSGEHIQSSRNPSSLANNQPQFASKPKEACHTMNVRECKIVNRPKESKVS